MSPASNSRADLLVYADWLLDEGRDAEAAAVRDGVEGAVAAAWQWTRHTRLRGFEHVPEGVGSDDPVGHAASVGGDVEISVLAVDGITDVAVEVGAGHYDGTVDDYIDGRDRVGE